MSSPKFMVFKLKDLRIPIIILLIAVAVFVFLLFRNKTATQTFAPSDTYQDGKYIAGISLSDAQMDLIVEIKDSKIASVSLDGLDEKTSTLYKDLASGIDYVNTYVTATQSLELPQNTNISPATTMLMDAVKVALSNDKNAQVTSTYEKLNLPDTQTTAKAPENQENTSIAPEKVDKQANQSEVEKAAPEKASDKKTPEKTSIVEEKVIEE